MIPWNGCYSHYYHVNIEEIETQGSYLKKINNIPKQFDFRVYMFNFGWEFSQDCQEGFHK